MKIRIVLFLTLFIQLVFFEAKAWEWNFNLNLYENYMSGSAVLLDEEGKNYGSPDIEVVAFYNDEVRGVSQATWEEADKQYVYYLTIYANAGENIQVVLKAFYKATGQPVVLESKEVVASPIRVNTSGQVGDVNAPSQIQPDANLALKAIRIKEDVQTYQAENQNKAFHLDVYPAGVSGFTVTYKQNGSPATPRNAGSYDVIISRPQDAAYQAYKRTLPGALVIGLSKPTVAWNLSVSANEGDRLSGVFVSGESGEGSFSWSNPEYTFQGSGEYWMERVFTPTNGTIYYSLKENVKVTVKAVERTEVSISATTPQRSAYTGSAKSFSFTSRPSGLEGFTVSYKKEGGTGTIAEAKDAGTYDVTVSRAQDTHYKAVSQTFKAGLVIDPIEPTVTWPTLVDLTLGDTLSQAILSGQSGEGVFSWENPGNIPTNDTDFRAKLIFTPTSPNYKTVSNDVLVTVIARKEITIVSDVQETPYDGEIKSFVVTTTPENTPASGFTVTYAQNKVTVENPVDAGTYDVTITRPKDEIYNPFNVTLAGGLVINKADFPSDSIVWPQSVSLYAGNTLSSVSIPSASNGSFFWEKPGLTFTEGQYKAVLIFKPSNGNYNNAKDSVTLVVTARPIVSYKVTVKQTEGGSLLVKNGQESIASGVSVVEGTWLTLEAKPDKGFTFSHFTVNGVKQTGNQVNVSGELLLEAVFIPSGSTGIEEVESAAIKWQVQSGSLFVEVPVRMKLQVVAVSGRVVYNQTIMAGTTQVGRLNKGIYLLVLTDSKEVSTVRKIVL